MTKLIFDARTPVPMTVGKLKAGAVFTGKVGQSKPGLFLAVEVDDSVVAIPVVIPGDNSVGTEGHWWDSVGCEIYDYREVKTLKVVE